MLKDKSILFWMLDKKTETGKSIDLKAHYFLMEIYRDFSQTLVIQKPAQVGLTTTQLFKTFWGIKHFGLDCIYTMPTVSEANEISKGKINRIIDQNPELKDLVKDMDTMSQKMVGKNILYIRGTWTERDAISHSSDWNIHDELDSSKQETIEQYSTRLQHSQHKWQHYFSHPSTENIGINKLFNKSDQKHWFITCSHCNKKQILTWPDSIDMEKQVYICKSCHKQLSESDRRVGEWVKKYKDREISGYQISLLMATWISAKEIINYHETKSPEYFYTKVLGLPYVGDGNKVTWEMIQKNVVTDLPNPDDRIIIGVDTGGTKWYVVGNKYGLFYYGSCKDYSDIERLLKLYPNSIVVIDGNGDPTATEDLFEKWKGRVFKCFFVADRKTQELVKWGKDRDSGIVHADRNRLIQRVVDEITDSNIKFFGQESPDDWYDYYLHWANMYREEEDNALGVPIKKWKRVGDDHLGLATAYWRAGVERFGVGMAKVISATNSPQALSVHFEPNNTGKLNVWKIKK